MFDIGEEVICIDDKGTTYLALDKHDGTDPIPVLLDLVRELKEGAHYHISWIGMYTYPKVAGLPRHSDTEALCVSVREIERDMPFRATRFVPIRKTKVETDISALTKLTKVKEMEDA